MSEKSCTVSKRWLAISSGGKDVFHVARWCGTIRTEFWFTFDLKTVFAERDEKPPNGHFDARNLPEKYKGGSPAERIRSAIDDGYDFSEITYNLD